ncbi:MAG: inositol monophosphatase family protein [Patescibacteria group bacterium]
MKNKSKELKVAIKAALKAGKVLEKYFETEILKEIKEDKSIVTLADRESEEIIKKIISGAFPNHSILGEETGMTENKSEYVWHVDPVDGTKNFANGIPLFAVSVALAYKNEVIVAVVYNPAVNSLFYAEKNKGAYFNDKKIQVSKDDTIHSIVSGGKSRTDEDRKLYRRLMYDLPEMFKGLTVRDFGSVALELGYVARGSFEATIQIGLHSYDFAAGILLVQESGGKVTNFDGTAYKFPGNYFIASNGVFHDLLVKEVQEQKTKLGI